ncbi:hypothetical protein DsansV1_C04g0037841 [Dioscorea sansibarensis]
MKVIKKCDAFVFSKRLFHFQMNEEEKEKKDVVAVAALVSGISGGCCSTNCFIWKCQLMGVLTLALASSTKDWSCFAGC